MKKIVMGIAAVAMAASMFAVDISSKVQMDTTLMGKSGDNVEFLKLNHKDQKDADALIFSASTDKAGAQFQLWYTYDGTNGAKDGNPLPAASNNPIRIRNVNVWFKPVDSLKVTVGDTALDSYKEHIFWWHGVYGAQPGTWAAFGGNYIEGSGAKVEYSANGLELAAALLPGVDKAAFTTGSSAYAQYALKAKYNYGAGSVAAVFADKGNGADKIIAIGTDYAGNGFYGMVNANIRLNNGVAGISLDNYEEYATGDFKIQAHLPFVMWKAGDTMKAGMYATVKVSYNVNGYTPYFLATTEPDGDAGWVFDGFSFAMTFKPGVTFNVGTASFDVALRMDVASGSFGWSVPCAIGVAL